MLFSVLYRYFDCVVCYLVFCIVTLTVLCMLFSVLYRYFDCVVNSVMISAYKRCSVRLYLQLFVGGFMSSLRCLCLFTYGGVQHILCCVFVLFFCTRCCLFLWIVQFVLPLLFSLDCPVCIASSVFSGLSSLYCLFCFLWIVQFVLPLLFSLDCPVCIASSVFSGLSSLYCLFCFLWIVQFVLPLLFSLTFIFSNFSAMS